MKCPYCAESIQDDAIVCRYCDARREGDGWLRAPATSTRVGTVGHGPGATVRIAGLFFLASAVLELTALNSATPLFGELRSGALAFAYHGIYLALFLAMGIGLWKGKPWGLPLMVAGTVFYTLDKVRYLFEDKARAGELAAHLQGFEGLLGAQDEQFILQAMDLAAVVSVLCWWGFLAYLYLKRSRIFGTA